MIGLRTGIDDGGFMLQPFPGKGVQRRDGNVRLGEHVGRLGVGPIAPQTLGHLDNDPRWSRLSRGRSGALRPICTWRFGLLTLPVSSGHPEEGSTTSAI